MTPLRSLKDPEARPVGGAKGGAPVWLVVLLVTLLLLLAGAGAGVALLARGTSEHPEVAAVQSRFKASGVEITGHTAKVTQAEVERSMLFTLASAPRSSFWITRYRTRAATGSHHCYQDCATRGVLVLELVDTWSPGDRARVKAAFATLPEE